MDDEAVNSKSKIFWTPGPVIIGAGPSGLAVSACLKQRGIPSLILEKESCIGSLWKQKTYDALKLHLPKKICQLPYVKFPSEYPIYPTKRQFITYLEDYASHFSINPLLGQEVQWAKYEERRRCWRVKTNEHEYRCRWLIVATGENAEPVVPRIPGVSEFKGTLLHTSAYKNGASFRRRKALVVGCGNSGMEISLDLCKNGANVFIVIRDKFHILPKQVLGNSTFALSMWLLKWFPVEVVDWFLLLCSRLIIGDTTQSGIRRPEIGPLKLKNSIGKTPVLDDGAFAKIKSGEIKVVNGIRKFTSNGAEFDDGTMEDFDVVIFATGYQNNTSWLQGAKFFNQKGGHREGSQPSNWKGENGVYSVGFTSQGLLGTSMDAHKVADDISKQWNSATEKVSLDA